MLLVLVSLTANAKTLDEVKNKGYLKCGVSPFLPGFAAQENDVWQGMDIDICQAVAIAIFNDATKVQYLPLSAKERFTALQSGNIDLLSRNTTWTFTRDVALGLEFIGINFYDGQGLMAPKSSGIKSAKELSGATVCTETGTTTELNIADFFRTNKMKYKIVSFDNIAKVIAAYNSGRCDVYSADKSALISQKIKLTDPNAHFILPDIISKEPLGPVVRENDSQWASIVRWTLYGLITAEEKNITSHNIKTMLQSNDPTTKRLLGTEGNLAKSLGLEKDFMVHVIEQIGNYGQIFERNLGAASTIGLERGLNELWSKGGLVYAPPYR